MSSDSRCTCHNTLVVKDLNRWFKEKWVDVSRKDKDGKHPPCGRSKAKLSGKGYPKCRPSVKVSDKTPKTSGSMSTGQKRAATKRKRAKKQGVGGKPTIVKGVAVLKARELSPEAQRHKKEYDTKYESSPERVKYREELNRERRRRGIYGSHNRKDVSHTQGGRLTLEGEHANRARHFKDKGTLRVMKSKQTTLSEFSPSKIEDAHRPHKYPTMTIGTKPGATAVGRKRAEGLSNQMLAELAGLKLPDIISAEGGSKWTEGGDTEPSFTIPRVSPEQQAKLLELAAKYGQEAVMYTAGQQKPSFRDTRGDITEQYQSSSITPKKPDYYTNYPGSNLYQTLN
jgi:hypothetical protein